MPETSSKPDPPSPSASFYDVSDDEEGGYNTIAHTSLSRGVKLLYSKSKVYVHPTKSAKDNIPGFIALVQQKSPQTLTDERPTSADSSKKKNNSSSYLLAWVPESALSQDDLSTYVKVDMKDGQSPPRQSYLVPPLPLATTFDESPVGPYAFSLPLSSIYSIHVRPPSLGWWYGSVVINTRAGSSLPALFFHDSECESTILQKRRRARETFDPFGETGDLYWGGDEVLRWLKRSVTVERSTAEPSIYLIDPSEEDLLGFGQGRKSMENQRQRGKSTSEQKKPSQQQKQPPGPGMDPLTKALKETRWKILEQLSKVTTFTRRTAEDLANNKNLPPQLRRILQNPEIQTWQDEYDSAKLYLAKWAASIAEQSDREKRQRIWTARDVLDSEETSVGDFEILEMEAGRMDLTGSKRRPVDLDEWRSFFDAKGSLQVTADEVKERIFHGGLDAEDGVRKEAWPFLLGVYDWNSTEQERHTYMNGKRDEYVQLKGAWWERMADNEATPEQEEWWKEQKNRIGKHEPYLHVAMRPVPDRLSTDLAIRHVEKDVHRTDRHIPLFAGEDIPHPDPTSPFYNADGPGTNVHMEQLKDMLLTYLEYDTPSSSVAASNQPSSSSSPRRVYQNQNPHPQNLGYVQGMSDLLSPLYAVFQDDALAFWAFVCFMRRMNRNFVRSQSGMRAQLATLDQMVQILDPKLYLHLQSADSTNFFFFFRMLLVWYKREFEWSDVLRLWESLWTDFYSSQFHLFVAVAILEKHRDFIMDHLEHFDEVLKYVNDLSGHIELQETLVRAEALFKRFEKTVEAVDRRNAFPAPGQTQGQSDSGTKQGGDGESTQNTTRPNPAAAGSSRSPGRQSSRPISQGRPTSKGGKAPEKDQEKVITPELRLLLSKKIITLEGEDSNEADGSRTRASGLKD